jgi:hypothetical protein
VTRTSVAVSEIARVAWWSLRALGCPLGAVERMAKVLAFSEVLEGGCLAALHHNEAQLTASFIADEPLFARKSTGYGVVDAKGRTFLDVGPRVVDALTGIARSGDTARFRVRGMADLLGFAGACVLAARRGVSVLSIRQQSDSPDHLAWALYFVSPTGIRRVSGDTDAGEAAIYRTLQGLVVAGASFPAIPEVPQSAESRESGCVVDVIGFAPRQMPAFTQNLHAALHGTDVSAALNDAYAHGVDVQTSDLTFLYQLETRTWAPSSERSRMQAGFGVPSPASSPSPAS